MVIPRDLRDPVNRWKFCGVRCRPAAARRLAGCRIAAHFPPSPYEPAEPCEEDASGCKTIGNPQYRGPLISPDFLSGTEVPDPPSRDHGNIEGRGALHPDGESRPRIHPEDREAPATQSADDHRARVHGVPRCPAQEGEEKHAEPERLPAIDRARMHSSHRWERDSGGAIPLFVPASNWRECSRRLSAGFGFPFPPPPPPQPAAPDKKEKEDEAPMGERHRAPSIDRRPVVESCRKPAGILTPEHPRHRFLRKRIDRDLALPSERDVSAALIEPHEFLELSIDGEVVALAHGAHPSPPQENEDENPEPEGLPTVEGARVHGNLLADTAAAANRGRFTGDRSEEQPP
jgi:hypothetical protein